MTQAPLHSMPRPRDVLLAQVRAVALALRWPAALAMALVAAATVMITIAVLDAGEVIDFHPEQWILPGLVGLLLPIAVWKGEERFGRGFLWTLPVDRRWHVLARVAAGWVWLVCAVALFVLWLLALALLSGERILAEETLRVLPSFSTPPPGAHYAGALQTVRRTPEALLWLVPFTAATGTYLLASALALGSRHPLRWIVGAGVGLFLLQTVGEAANVEWLYNAPTRLLEPLLVGPYGLDTLLTARTVLLKIGTTLSTGEEVVVWRELPDVGQWAAATLLWTVAGLVSLWAAASRHRERRRG
jgi:hypothetical protein